MRGHARADSWSTDAHKWLNVPYDSGLVFVRDAAAHHAAMTLGAEYYVETEGGERDPFNWTPESSRRARGFAILAALRSMGRSGLIDLIDRDCRLARRMAGLLAADPRVSDPQRGRAQPGPRPVRGAGRRPGRDVEATPGPATSSPTSSAMGRAGSAGRRGTGRAVMRISVSGWQTTEDDIDRSAAAILACLDKVEAEAG